MSHALFVSLALGVLLGQLMPAQPRDARPATAPSGTAAIRGRVSSGESGLPIRRAIVSLIPVVAPQPVAPAGSGAQPPPRVGAPSPPFGPPRNAVTDANGHFEFAGLAGGRYRIRVQPPMHSSQYLGAAYGGKDMMDPGREIELRDGEPFDQANVALLRGGAITGRVLDENGEPLTRVMVLAARVMPGSGTLQRMGGGWIQSDDYGRYRIFGLEAGSYVVSAEARGTGGPPVEGVDSEGFMQTYHPSVPNDREATRVRVRTAAEVEGVDIQMIRTRTFRITVNVMDSKGQPVARPNVQLLKQVSSGVDSGVGSMGMDQQGRFTLRDVPPGDYSLVVSTGMFEPPQPGAPPPVREYAMVPVSVTADIDNLVVVTRRGVSVQGQVVFTDAQPPVRGGELRVFSQPAQRRPMFGPQSSATVDADLRFTLGDLVGPQLIRISLGPRRDWAVKAVMLGAADITDTPVEFKSEHTGHLQILVSTRAAMVEGTVTGEDGSPVEQAMVMIFPEDRDRWRVGSPHVRTTMTTQGGRYTMGGLVGGRYYAVAVSRRDLIPSMEMPLDVFEALTRDATRLVVADDERRVVDLTLSKGPE